MMDRHKNPFECYFCHKKIENDTEMGHTSICGNVLQPCPHKCGSYIIRADLPMHMKECVNNRLGRSMTRLTTTTDTIETYDDGLATASLDRRVNHSTTRDAIDRLQRDFQNMSIKLANYELSSSSNGLDSRKNQDLEKMKYQSQLLLEWKKAVDFKLETLHQSISFLERNRSETEYHWAMLQQKLMVVDKLQADINLAMDKFLQEQNYNRQNNLEFAKNLNELKDLFEHESTSVSTLWNEQKIFLEDVQRNLDLLKQAVEELKAKNSSLVFDVKTINQIASETEDKLEIKEREFARMERSFEQIRNDMDILEDLARADARTSSPGHLIWKISNFQDQLQKSKQSNTVHKSPIFYTHDFGYKIKILAYLNGMKKWKDRYALFSIHVLKGDFDPLLKWPCHIEGTVTLRDQENFENPKILKKRIVAKREVGGEETEEPQESSSSYIFIPHEILKKPQYLKDDQIFLEVRIDHNRKLATETTL